MNPKYIIVQAGGKGSRMQTLTRNKPKALVPVDNLPIIFHLFKKYPDKKYIVIGDYKSDVLEKYLNTFADVEFKMIFATGNTGTCAGLKEALQYIPESEEFALIWCDLILADDYHFPEQRGNYVGIAKDFSCRWSWKDGQFWEEKSNTHGVAGYFLFENKNILVDIPQNGEFVRWMKDKNLTFMEDSLWHAHEYGVYDEWEKKSTIRCRPFNSVEIKDGLFIKRAINEQGKQLAEREVAWYKKIQLLSKESDKIQLPYIHKFNPLTMELINGKNLYKYSDIPYEQKVNILKKITDCLDEIHKLDFIPSNKESFYEAYIGKTKERLNKIKDLVPFSNHEKIKINGKQCRNIFYNWEIVENTIEKYFPKEFVLLHGDCTFSNMMLKDDLYPVLFDPRGYFGNTELYGDEAYDWAKLYYSLFGNYDQFNLKNFSLDITDEEVYLKIKSNNWEDVEDEFFRLIQGKVTKKQLKIYLAIIWLSLTTYAWEDYDSICGAYYQGLFYLEEALLMSDEGTGDIYFGETIKIITDSLQSLDMNSFEDFIQSAKEVLEKGHKIIVSGLGKNVPVCEKFAGTMTSLGFDACFMHTNTAVHGDLGMVKKGDMVIILSKSGNTAESVYLAEQIKQREVTLKSITFSENNRVANIIGHKNNLAINMEHEGDMWNMVPNNSTTLNLIVLQGLAMALARRMELDLIRDFAPNHPGGAIGRELSHVKKD